MSPTSYQTAPPRVRVRNLSDGEEGVKNRGQDDFALKAAGFASRTTTRACGRSDFGRAALRSLPKYELATLTRTLRALGFRWGFASKSSEIRVMSPTSYQTAPPRVGVRNLSDGNEGVKNRGARLLRPAGGGLHFANHDSRLRRARISGWPAFEVFRNTGYEPSELPDCSTPRRSAESIGRPKGYQE